MSHAAERVAERLTDAGCSTDYIDTVFRTARFLASKCQQDTAICLVRLPERVNPAWGDRSNGNQVWAIIRDQQVCTVMLRRDTQPDTLESLRVDRVIYLRSAR